MLNYKIIYIIIAIGAIGHLFYAINFLEYKDTKPDTSKIQNGMEVINLQIEETNDTTTYYDPRSKLHGFQKKEGMINPQLFHHEYRYIRNQVFGEWINYKIQDVPDLISPAMTFPECQIIINHHYKFIWIKGHKVGGTTLMSNFANICGDSKSFHNGRYCGWVLSNTKVNSSSTELEKYWKDYFVFGFIRNPYSRFVSSYYYVQKYGDKFTKRHRLLDKNCTDFLWPHEYCYYYNCSNLSDFSEIIDISFLHKHYKEQSRCIFNDELLLAVDFVGETEYMERDVNIIVDYLNKRKNKNLPNLPKIIKSLNVNQSRKRFNRMKLSLDELFYKRKPECINSVNNAFNRDFKLLGYDKVDPVQKFIINPNLRRKASNKKTTLHSKT